MKIIDATGLSGFARKTAESASDFAGVVHNLIMDVRDSYRSGLRDMRGPGPKWRAKHHHKHPRLMGFARGSTHPTAAASYDSSCGGLPVLEMPVDWKAPGCLGAWKSEKIDPSAIAAKEKIKLPKCQHSNK